MGTFKLSLIKNDHQVDGLCSIPYSIKSSMLSLMSLYTYLLVEQDESKHLIYFEIFSPSNVK